MKSALSMWPTSGARQRQRPGAGLRRDGDSGILGGGDGDTSPRREDRGGGGQRAGARLNVTALGSPCSCSEGRCPLSTGEPDVVSKGDATGGSGCALRCVV